MTAVARSSVAAYRQRAVELVNAGKLQVTQAIGAEVKECGDGAFVDVSVFVPAAALVKPSRCKCWRRWGPCARCAEERILTAEDLKALGVGEIVITIVPGGPTSEEFARQVIEAMR